MIFQFTGGSCGTRSSLLFSGQLDAASRDRDEGGHFFL
jgi:hypothetical protein